MKSIKDLELKKFRDFTTMNDLWKSLCKTMTAKSWGIHNPVNYKGKALRFTVNCNHHRGHVYIFVNGADLFDVYYTSNRGNIKDVEKDVFVGDLLSTIDDRVEKVSEYAW